MLLLSCCFSDTVTDITNVQNSCCLLLLLSDSVTENNTLAKTQVVIELLFRLCHCYYVVPRAVVLSDTVVNTNMTQVVAMLFFWVVNTKQIFNHK